MSEKGSIATVTLNPAIDKSSSVTHVEAEVKMRCAKPDFEPGGGGINVSRVVKELGGNARTLYVAGGPTGDLLKLLLADHNLDHSEMRIQEMTRENLVIYEERSGEQYRFNMPGPHISAEEADRLAQQMCELPQEYIVASGSLPPGLPVDFYARPAAHFRKSGQRYIVDTSGPALRAAVDEFAYLIKPNMREMRALVDYEVTTPEEAKSAAQDLIGRGCCTIVVVSLGSDGALVVNEAEVLQIPSPDITPLSKVGAGDSMVAGIVYQLAQGASVSEAARYGVAAGAAACLTPGTGLCRYEDVERLYAEIKA